MKTISVRAREMQASPIRKLIPYAVEARKRGLTVYPLNIGQPDVPTPKPIRDAIQSFSDEVLAYSPSQGEEYLRDAFSEYYRRNNINIAAQDLIVTTGGSEALFFAFMSICDLGDEIIVFEPFYTNYNGIALETGVNLRPLATYAENGFQLPPAEVIEKAITPKTRAILICNPNNPTGTVYPKESIEMLAKVAQKHNIYVIADEVYREFVYDGLKHFSILQVPGTENNTILVDSISKRYSACGARIGLVACRNRDVVDCCLKFAQARLSSPTVEQWAAKAGVDMNPSYFEPILQEYQRRRDAVMTGLKNIPGVVCETPKGAFYVIAKLPIKDAERFSLWLLKDFSYENSSVIVAPAAGFYATKGLGANEIRISYVLEVEKLQKAMRVLGEAVKQFQIVEGSNEQSFANA